MKEQIEKLSKLMFDIQSKVEKLAKENGVDTIGAAKMDVIEKTEFEKMKADLFDMQKKLAESKMPAVKSEEEAKSLKGFSRWLLKVKYNASELNDERIKTVMSEGTNAQGGFTVPTGYSDTIIGYLNDLPMLVNRMTPVIHGRMDGFTKNIPQWLTDLTVAWVAEAATKSTTKPTFTRLQSVLHVLYALISLTDEYLADDITDISKQIAMLVAENFAMELERVALIGNTGGTDHFDGVYYAVPAAQLVDQAGANLAYIDFVNAFTSTQVIQRYKTKAEWFMNQSAYGLALGLVDGQNRPIWNLNSALVDQPFGNILGRPVNITDVISSALGDNSDHTAIMYGDPKFILHGKKQGENMQVIATQTGVINVSTSVTENALTEDKTFYRFTERDSIVVVPDAWYVINEVR